MIRTVEWRNGAVVMIDQRLLPTQEVYRVYRDYREVARAIKDMVIRGAPAIGVAAAMGIALGVRSVAPRQSAARLRAASATLRGDAPDGGQSVLGDRAHAARVCAAATRRPPPSIRSGLLEGGAGDSSRGHRRQPRAWASTAPA